MVSGAYLNWPVRSQRRVDDLADEAAGLRLVLFVLESIPIKAPDEAPFYPFAPKRDLIDASSRIYDMNATAPVQNEGRMAEPKSYADS
jgi:hypothetical protein